jgi:hypothetical protein
MPKRHDGMNAELSVQRSRVRSAGLAAAADCYFLRLQRDEISRMLISVCGLGSELAETINEVGRNSISIEAPSHQIPRAHPAATGPFPE